MKIDLNLPIKTLKGEDHPTETLGSMLANELSFKAKGMDPIKAFNIAVALTGDGAMDIDLSDLKLIETLVRGSERMTTLVQGQLLIELDKQGREK